MLSLLLRSRPVVTATICRAQQRAASASSASRVIPYRQDLPPAGGYAPFDWVRIPQKRTMNPIFMFLAWAAITFYGWCRYQRIANEYRLEKLEMNERKLAMEPLLHAEMDRLYLKGVRRQVEEEHRIMKDVPEWELGKWYHEPIFRSVPPGHWIDMSSMEFWNHANRLDYDRWRQWWWLG